MSSTGRMAALMDEAWRGAEKIYARMLPKKIGSPDLCVDTLNRLITELEAGLAREKMLMRQRGLISSFLGTWEKLCAKEARK